MTDRQFGILNSIKIGTVLFRPQTALLCGYVVIGLCLFVFVGWQFDKPLLRSLIPGQPETTPLTALMLICLAISLAVSKMALSFQTTPVNAYRMISLIMTGTAMILGIWTTIQYILGLGPSTELLLYRELILENGGNYPGRPSPHTVITCLLLGSCILFSLVSNRSLYSASGASAVVGFVIPWLAVFGYVTLSSPFYTIDGSPQTGMSLITAICFLSLFIGAIWLRPDIGFVRLLRARTSGGIIVRLMLPAAVLIPLIFGWLSIYESQYLGLFDDSVLVALNWGVTSLLLAALITLGGFILNKRDTEVINKQKEVDNFFSLSVDLLCMIGFDGYLKRVNPSFEEYLGYSNHELYSNPLLHFVHPDDFDSTKDNLYIPQMESRTISFESRFLCKDGSIKWLAWTATPQKETGLIYAVARDITARMGYQASIEKHAQESEALALIGEVINYSPDIKEIYQEFAELVSRILPYDRLSINIVDCESNSYTAAYSYGKDVPNRRPTDSVPLSGTLVEEVINTAQPLLLDETDVMEKFPGFQPSGLNTILMIPLQSSNGIIGALSLRSATNNAYSEEDMRFAKRVADQISGAIANSQLRADLQQRAREREVVSAIGRIITSSLDISRQYDKIAEQIAHLIPYDRISVDTFDYELGVIRHTYVEGVDVPGYGIGDLVELSNTSSDTFRIDGQERVLNFSTTQHTSSISPSDRAASEAGLNSALMIPMVSNGNVIAGIDIRSKKHNAYSSYHLDLMERIGRQVARAIANSNLHNQVQQEAEERTVIAEIGKIINSSLDLNQVFGGFADQVRRIIPFDRLSLIMIDPSAEKFRTVCSEGIEIPGRDSTTAIPLTGTVVGEIVNSRKALVIDEDTDEMRSKFPNFQPVGLKTSIGIPLLSEGRVVGVLTMRSKAAKAYSSHHIGLIEHIGEQITGAVVNSQLYEAQLLTQEALGESERRYRSIIESSSDVMYTTDADGVFNYANEPAESLTGYPREEIIGKHFLDLVHPDWKSKVKRSYQRQYIEENKERNLEFPVVTKEGAVRWVDQTVTVQINNEEIEGFQAVLRDVTERREAQEDFRKLSRQKDLILQSAGEGIYGIDLEGRVTFVNSAAATMVGWEPQDLIGKTQHEILHHTKADGYPYPLEECPIYSALEDGDVHKRNDEIFWRKDGTSFPVEYISTPIVDGGQAVGAVVTFQDISQRREVERLKDEFVSMVSHELRTPLTSIRGSLGLIAGGAAGDVPDKAKRMIEIASTNTDRLVRLINDILDIERIESGKTSIEKVLCDTGELIEQAIGAMNGMAQSVGITLQSDFKSQKLLADPDRILQTLTNLISNAIKFSPEDGTVSLEIETQEEFVVFKVRDEGRGIPEDKISSIFGRFQQVDASDSRDKGGTGLGLAICKSIVELHGGRIWVESQYGNGSTFYFAIPGLIKSEDQTSSFESITSRILYCDDEADTLEVVGEFLAKHDYWMIPAQTGAEALNLAANSQPDVILLDIMIPDMDGWEILASLKSNPNTTDIPVVILSNVIPENGESTKNGVAGWVTKLEFETQLINALNNVRNKKMGFRQVLLVEDDLDLSDTLTAALSSPETKVLAAPTARRAIEICRNMTPDLLILDLSLPDANGYNLLKWLRRQKLLENMPVVVYTASDLNSDELIDLRKSDAGVFVKSRITPDDFSDHILKLLDEVVGEREVVYDK